MAKIQIPRTNLSKSVAFVRGRFKNQTSSPSNLSPAQSVKKGAVQKVHLLSRERSVAILWFCKTGDCHVSTFLAMTQYSSFGTAPLFILT